MTVILALLALQPTPAHRAFDIGGGLQVNVTEGANDMNYPDKYYASSIEVRRGGMVLAKVRTRPLIEGWLKFDNLWGSHDVANQIRYKDAPRSGVTRGVQGKVYEVTRSAGGCLFRIGVIAVFPSSPRISFNVILRWKASAPDKWPVIYSFADGSPANWHAVQLPRYRGVDYALDGRSVYRLSADSSKWTLVATIPPEGHRDQDAPTPNWYGVTQQGADYIIVQPDNDPERDIFRDLNLLTGKNIRLTEQQLRAFGVELPLPDGM